MALYHVLLQDNMKSPHMLLWIQQTVRECIVSTNVEKKEKKR